MKRNALLLAILSQLVLLAGCATTGTTPANSDTEAKATDSSSQEATTNADAPAKKPEAGGGEPECD